MVAPVTELRPTPDRVRETLFNWLAPVIDGAKCLDCYAGTGALGFEALSRGAAHAVLVEENGALAKMLQKQAQALGAHNAEIIRADVRTWLKSCRRSFDIAFVDPPFATDLGIKTCVQLAKYGHLAPGGVIYLESGPGVELPAGVFNTIKQARAGQVHFRLLEPLRGGGGESDDHEGDLSRDV